MSRRTERIAKLVQQVLGQILLEGLSDPRIDPARVSITRVEVAEDMMRAKVYISAMEDEAGQRRTLQALRHAAGRLQERMMEQIELRFTPVLDFVPDVQFKKSLATLVLIQQAMEELRQREGGRAASETAPEDDADEPPAEGAGEEPQSE